MRVVYLADQDGLFIPIYKPLNPTGNWSIDEGGLMWVESQYFYFFTKLIPETAIEFIK